MVVVRDPRHLYAAMAVNAPYLVIGEAREPSTTRRVLAAGAGDRGVGRAALAGAAGCRPDRAHLPPSTRFATGCGSGYEILNDVAINQVLVSFATPS